MAAMTSRTPHIKDEANSVPIRDAIRRALAPPIAAAGLSDAEVDDELDLIAAGILDSYDLVDIIVEVESLSGLKADLTSDRMKIDGEVDFFASVTRLVLAFESP